MSSNERTNLRSLTDVSFILDNVINTPTKAIEIEVIKNGIPSILYPLVYIFMDIIYQKQKMTTKFTNKKIANY